ncbi:hypothetical protein CM19_01640 [Candidatus Acidianus copahuensis]|uniref:PaREP1 family protein n=1 Tax=Candidatus Acidianus copahuensis TaxID=1160895 RepID=A0A031LU98_9CREN|nr:PaREP1 family protein [Candidatus Acidianus copahuensis]EZQ11401.1 hypothetical protein CM19_01640 [Candidatus Acidianus copahuensis]
MTSIDIPEGIYLELKKKSEISNKPIEDILTDIVLSTLNTEEEIRVLQSLSYEMEKRGDLLEEKGDLVSAGEAYWKSLSFILKAIGLRLGFEISTYQDYFSIIDYLSYKTGRNSLIVDFLNSEKLHGEFHPRPQDDNSFTIRRSHLKTLLTVLRQMITQTEITY